MKYIVAIIAIVGGLLINHHVNAAVRSQETANPLIDFKGYQKDVKQVAKVRDQRLLNVKDFLKMSQDPNTIVLDARSTDRYMAKHLKGAKHLAYTDFTAENLAQVIPSKDARILIYCNNNFRDNSRDFATKGFSTALNISTMVALKGYGYENVYELGPALYENDKRLTFETSL